MVYFDFDASLPAAQKGQAKSITDPQGNVTTVTSVNGDGKPLDVQRTSTTGGTTTTESYLYAYIASGTNAGKIESVTLRRQIGAGSWTTVRKSEYEYFGTGSSNGTSGDVKTVVIKDGSSSVLDNSYYRYFTTSSSTGYAGALKFAVTGDSYERLKKWCDDNSTTPDGATDAQVAVFAVHAFEYDGLHRVTKHIQQGTGCSSCAGGLGQSTFAYTTSAFADGYNSWRNKTVETRADGNTMTYYTNFAGQIIVEVFKDTTTNNEWLSYSQYDSVGRLKLTAAPSAISGYDDTYADLMHNQSGNYQYLRDSQGLIATTSFYTSTTATSTTAGGVNGYQYQSHIQRGETGSAILQNTTDYFSRTDGTITIYPVANTTQYRATNGTGGQTSSYAYTWFSGTVQPESVTGTLPTVTTAQNGSNSANTSVTVSDARGRTIWAKDEAGYINNYQYDDVTGGTTKTIRDVDTTQTGTFSNLPSGWSTPSAGPAHIKPSLA